MFKSSSIGFRLIISFLAISLVLLIGGLIQYHYTNSLADLIDRTRDRSTRIDAQSTIRAKLNRYLFVQDEIVLSSDEAYIKEMLKDNDESAKMIIKCGEAILNGGECENGKVVPTHNPKVIELEKALLEHFRGDFLSVDKELIDTRMKILEAKKSSQDTAQLEKKLNEINDRCNAAGKKMIGISREANKEFNADSKKADEAADQLASTSP